MASKTLARTGASLINRLFTNSLNASWQSNSYVLPQISMNPPLPCFLPEPLNNKNFQTEGCKNAESLKMVASPERFIFPCGLPFLRFFIEDGKILLCLLQMSIFLLIFLPLEFEFAVWHDSMRLCWIFF